MCKAAVRTYTYMVSPQTYEIKKKHELVCETANCNINNNAGSLSPQHEDCFHTHLPVSYALATVWYELFTSKMYIHRYGSRNS